MVKFGGVVDHVT